MSPKRSSPLGRQMPELPLSRDSSVTRNAPASRSSWMHSIQRFGARRSERSESLKPTSETTLNSAASFLT